MKMKKIIALILALALVFALAAGCSSGEKESTEPSAATSAKPSTKPTETPTEAPTETPADDDPTDPPIEDQPLEGEDYNAAIAGYWYYSEDYGESSICFDGVATATMSDPYGAVAGNYYCDGAELSIYTDTDAYYGSFDSSGAIVLLGVDGWFTQNYESVKPAVEPVDTSGLNATDYVGVWESVTDYIWLYIYGDGKYQFFNSDGAVDGENGEYAIENGALVLSGSSYEWWLNSDGDLHNSNAEVYYASELPDGVGEVDDEIGKGDSFDDENIGLGDQIDDQFAADITYDYNAPFEGKWAYSNNPNYTISFDGFDAALFSSSDGQEECIYSYDGVSKITFYQDGSPVDSAHVDDYGLVFLDSLIDGFFCRVEDWDIYVGE